MSFNDETTKQKFQDAVLTVLARSPGGEDSLSHVRAELTQSPGARWRGLGTSVDFQNLLEEAGFTVRHWDSRAADRKAAGHGVVRYTTVSL
jgi:hypothetical protein